MRQRVKEFGGELHLENSAPGTRLEVSIPTGSLSCPEANATPGFVDNLRAPAPDEQLRAIASLRSAPAPAPRCDAPSVSIPSAASSDVVKDATRARVLA